MGRRSAVWSTAVRRAFRSTVDDIQRDLDRRRPGPVALHHAAAGGRRGEDPLGRDEDDRDRRAGDDRNADRAADRKHGSALEGLLARSRTSFGPGHADFTYETKYGMRDYRGGGRSSARETASRVAAGAIARKILPGVTMRGALVQMGTAQDRPRQLGLGRGRPESVLLPRRGGRRVLRATISMAFARAAPRSAR